MWQEKWIRDCSPADVAKKLVSLCDMTGERAEGKDDCVACRLLKEKDLSLKYLAASEAYREASIEAHQSRTQAKSAINDVKVYMEQVDALQKQVNELKGLIAQADAAAKIARVQAADARQDAQDVRSRHSILFVAHQAATAELDRIKSALAALV